MCCPTFPLPRIALNSSLHSPLPPPPPQHPLHSLSLRIPLAVLSIGCCCAQADTDQPVTNPGWCGWHPSSLSWGCCSYSLEHPLGVLPTAWFPDRGLWLGCLSFFSSIIKVRRPGRQPSSWGTGKMAPAQHSSVLPAWERAAPWPCGWDCRLPGIPPPHFLSCSAPQQIHLQLSKLIKYGDAARLWKASVVTERFPWSSPLALDKQGPLFILRLTQLIPTALHCLLIFFYQNEVNRRERQEVSLARV